LEDFANLLGPNGTIAAYFNQNLKSLVDTSGAVWRWQSGGGANVGLNPDTLTQMQRAAKIRTVFFQGGNGQLGFSVVITPRELDRGVRSADLTIDDQSISYSFGPQQPTRIQWPGPSGLGQIRLALIPEDGGPTPTITATGPWAWYRFVDQGRVEQSPSGGALRLTFNVSGRRVSYDISGSSLFTPLTSQDLISFHCSPL
jgi:type VI secretion system protein ImpL